MWRLQEKPLRFSELKRDIPHITDKMLTSQLRELESKEMIHREVFPVVPPKVEYSLTEKGKKSIPVIETIMQFGYDLMKDEGIVFPPKE
ncbi:winged helix-turn-helix transcriptional regulator [Chryseobacterium indologenes]